jgi:hypothetical protein
VPRHASALGIGQLWREAVAEVENGAHDLGELLATVGVNPAPVAVIG